MAELETDFSSASAAMFIAIGTSADRTVGGHAGAALWYICVLFPNYGCFDCDRSDAFISQMMINTKGVVLRVLRT